jgi:hypothetical protein
LHLEELQAQLQSTEQDFQNVESPFIEAYTLPVSAGGTLQYTFNMQDPVPLPVKSFEKFHYILQDQIKTPDVPQTLKRWKNQLT